MDWLSEHPEFLDNDYYYLDERTNEEIGEVEDKDTRLKWRYYDIKEKEVKFMPPHLKKALIESLKPAYDKIDECKALDEFRETINKRKSQTKFKLLFDHSLGVEVLLNHIPLTGNPLVKRILSGLIHGLLIFIWDTFQNQLDQMKVIFI